MSEAVVQIGPCYCHVMDGPHVHLGDCDVVRWDAFQKSFEDYMSKNHTQFELVSDFELVTISAVPEEQIVDENCKIGITSKPLEGKS